MNLDAALHNSQRTAGTMPVWNANSSSAAPSKDKFQFADLIDMVNPLQHIPLVNIAYQKITGDEIKPISQVVGGAVFGGAVGAGSALVNVAIEAETGKNIGEHAIAMVETAPQNQYQTASNRTDHPEDNLNNALALLDDVNAQSAIAFANLSYPEYQRVETKPVADGRTAGHTRQQYFDITAQESIPAPREPITQLHMSDMPQRYNF